MDSVPILYPRNFSQDPFGGCHVISFKIDHLPTDFEKCLQKTFTAHSVPKKFLQGPLRGVPRHQFQN